MKAMLELTFQPNDHDGSGPESSGKGIARYFIFKEQISLYGNFSSYPIYRNSGFFVNPYVGIF